ncbi:MAG: hypothetical protein H7832_13775 [Magnetococcus sp. DMHC-6]
METKRINYLREMAFILFSQKKVIVRTSLLFFLCFVAYAVFSPDIYRASGSFLVRGKKVDDAPDKLESVQLRSSPVTDQDLFSEVELLMSDEVMRATIVKMLNENTWPLKPGSEKQEDPDAQMRSWISILKGGLKTEPIPKSNIIKVQLEWKDPGQAKLLLHNVMQHYLRGRELIYNPPGEGQFFSDQVENSSQGIKDSNKSLLALYTNSHSPDPIKEIENNLQLRQGLELKIYDLQSKILNLQMVVKQIDEVLASPDVQLFSFIVNPGIQLLSAKLQDLLLERSKIRKNYQPDSSAVLVIERHVQDAYLILKQEVISYRKDLVHQLTGDEEESALLSKQIKDINVRNSELKQVDLEAQALIRESGLQEFTYKTFYQRREEVRLRGGGKDSKEASQVMSHVVVMSQAQAMMTPVKPKRVLVVVIGFFLSVLLGFLTGMVVHGFDHTFKQQSDVEGSLKLPIIFSISDLHVGTVSAKPQRPTMKTTNNGMGKIGVGSAIATLVVVALLWIWAWSTTGATASPQKMSGVLPSAQFQSRGGSSNVLEEVSTHGLKVESSLVSLKNSEMRMAIQTVLSETLDPSGK